MKFEYQVKLFSAGQPPDQIEKVLNQSGESGWEVVATFVKQDSTLCFVLKKTHRAETAGGVVAAVGCSGGDGISRHEKKLSLLIAGKPSSLWQFAGLRLIGWDFWTFIPKGDMPRWTCVILEVLDRVGRLCRLGACRRGLILTATRDV